MPAGQSVGVSQTEEIFVLQSLRTAALRADGRKFGQSRSLVIEFGEQLGWCQVSLGETVVVASVSAELVPPKQDRPYEGMLQINTEVTPMAGIEYDAGAVGVTEARDREALFERILERAVRNSDAVDREALCVIAGKRVWSIALSVHLLADEGAAGDAAVLASMVALRHFRRPEVSILNGDVTVYSTDEHVPVPLAMHHMPLAISYALFLLQPKTDKERSLLLAQSHTQPVEEGMEMDEKQGVMDIDIPVSLLDPSLLEQALADSGMTFVLNAQREVSVIEKAGGSSVPYKTILALLHDAAGHIGRLGAQVDEALAADTKHRVVSVL